MAYALRRQLLTGVGSGREASIIMEKCHAGLEGFCKVRQNKRVMGWIGGPCFDRDNRLISALTEGKVGDDELAPL